MKAENNSKPWTPEEDKELRELVLAGASRPEIAERLGRSESGVKTRAYILRPRLGRLRKPENRLNKTESR